MTTQNITPTQYLSKKQRLELLRSQLEDERSSFIGHWRDLNDYIQPRRGRFFLNDVNRGDRRNQKIINSTATTALRTLRSGMMSGITSPARQWFKLTTPDPDLADFGTVKQWLHVVEQRMLDRFRKSNFYQQVNPLYGDLGLFGTAGMILERSRKHVIHCQELATGSYSLGRNAEGKIDTQTRVFQMTVHQIVEKFGYDELARKINWQNISPTVKGYWDTSQYQKMIDVVHVICPNDEYDPSVILPEYRKYGDYYYELCGDIKGYADERFLSKSGSDQITILGPRWEVTGEDTYGTDCPGMIALGDVKQLQLLEKRKAQAIEKMIFPPMQGPSSLRGVKTSLNPHDMTYWDQMGGVNEFKPIHEIKFNANDLKEDILNCERRIDEAFFKNIMLMFSESDRRQITAREIEERGAEKFLVLGPVLQQVEKDLLDPSVDAMFAYMQEFGELPPAPEELKGIDLKIEYVSILAQAQKVLGLQNLREFGSMMANTAKVDPRALRKLNTFEYINVVADVLSVPPKVIVADDDAVAAEQQDMAAQQRQVQVEQANQAASTAKTLSETQVSEQNALGKILGV